MMMIQTGMMQAAEDLILGIKLKFVRIGNPTRGNMPSAPTALAEVFNIQRVG